MLATALLTPWLIALSACNPFGTVNDAKLHQHNEHQMVTRLALQCGGDKSDGICFEAESLNNLAGIIGKNGAVGSPDGDDLHILPEGPEAHCDDADFFAIPGYHFSRDQATGQLQQCVEHLKARFTQGILSAGRMIDKDNQVIDKEVNLVRFGYCFFDRDSSQATTGRAKCSALEGLGRALHGTEDFYSHSNWADREDTTRPISVVNPPGLAKTSLAPFLDLRAHGAIQLSRDMYNLTTGCFNAAELLPGNGGTGSFGCKNRVIHLNLNKDHGVIDPKSNVVTPDADGVPRSAVPGNFAAAVRMAVLDTRERWSNFRDELRIKYRLDPEKASLIICAMVRDDPAKDCRRRKIAIVVDSSGSNTLTDPSNLRIQAAKEVNAKLLKASQAGPGVIPDKVAVVDFDDSARLLYAMGDPSGAATVFDAIDSSGGTNIGAGIALGIDEILKDEPDIFVKRSGIIVLTDGQDGNPAYQVLQLARAKLHGIRVTQGLLSPLANPVPRKRSLAKRDPDPDITTAILSTGGTFAIIESAKAQKNFIDLVVARGCTDIDGVLDSTILISGVTVTEHVTSNKTTHQFSYSASSSEHLNITLSVVTAGQTLFGVLRDIRQNADIGTLNATSRAPSSIKFDATAQTELEFIVTSPSMNLTEIVFSVGMSTNMPEKNETTSSSIMSSTTSSLPNVTSSIYTATSTAYYPTLNVTTSLPSCSYFTAPNSNSSGVYYHPTSIVSCPTSRLSESSHPSCTTDHYTYISTSVYTTTTTEVTTVCYKPSTSPMTIFPTSRYTNPMPSPPSYGWVSSMNGLPHTGAPTTYPSNPVPGYSHQNSASMIPSQPTVVHGYGNPALPLTIYPPSSPTYRSSSSLPSPGLYGSVNELTKGLVDYTSSPTGVAPASARPVSTPPTTIVGIIGTSANVPGTATTTVNSPVQYKGGAEYVR